MEKTKTGTLKLLRRSRLLPGESISSLLIRLAKANYYNPYTLLSDHIQSTIKAQGQARDRLSYPYQLLTYECIATMTKIEVSRLHAATPHNFALVTTPPSETVKLLDGISAPLLAPGIASKQLHPTYAGRFCPMCLKASAYHRLTWMSIAVSACLEHSCLLLNCCHSCGKEVPIRDIVTTQCSRCKSDLTEANTLSLADDKFGLLSQSIVQSWLMNSITPQDTATMLSAQSPRVLYRVMDGLQQVIRAQANSEWTYLHTVNGTSFTFNQERRILTPYESYCLYTTAFKGLINWPNGFYNFLQAYQGQMPANRSAYGGPKANLGNLYTQWLQGYWQYPAFDFVQKAFEEYFIRTYHLSSSVARSSLCQSNPNIVNELKYINFAEAARITGTTPRLIEIQASAGRLASYTSDDNSKYKYVSRVEVQEICRRWNEGIERSEAAKWLGVTEKMIVDMVNIGLLPAEHSPSDGFPRWMFAKSALIELLDKASERVRLITLGEEHHNQLIDLTGASRLVFVVGLDAVHIIQWVIEGKLCAYNEAKNEYHLGTLLFAHADLQQRIEDVKSENDWISREEATKLLEVKDATLARWVKIGLLSPSTVCGHVQYFSRSVVNQFIADHITSDEASQILGVGKLATQKWARMGRLSETCVSGPNVDGYHAYLFNRARLIQWRNERLTFGEAVGLIGVSKATFHQWISEGKIEPLDDMGGKQRWFARQAVLNLQELARHR
jgi:hypothetical protein